MRLSPLSWEKNQKKAPPERGLKSCLSDSSGDRLDPGGLRALRALGDLVLDALSFLQAAEALGVDAMNPNPLASLNHFTVPYCMTRRTS